jgi:hypothetical protein
MTRAEHVRTSLVAEPRIVWVITGVCAFLAGAVGPLMQTEWWVGWLPTTTNAVELVAAPWTPILVGAIAAWVAGIGRASKMTEWLRSAPRAPRQQLRPVLIAIGVVVVIANLGAVAVVMGVSWHFGLAEGWVASQLLWVIPGGVANLLVWAGVGAWLGQSWRRELAIPVAALLPYLVWALLSMYGDGTPLAGLALANSSVWEYVRPTTGVAIVRATVWMALAATVWAHLLAPRSRLARAVPWALSGLLSVALLQGMALEPINAATAPVCEGNNPKLCLDRSHATVMPRYRAAVSALWPGVPVQLRPVVMGSSPEVMPGAKAADALVLGPVAGNYEPSRIVDQKLFVARLGDALFLTPCQGQAIAGNPSRWLALWWRTSHGGSMTEPAYPGDGLVPSMVGQEGDESRAAAFARLTSADRATWFDQNAAAIRSCSATTAP